MSFTRKHVVIVGIILSGLFVSVISAEAIYNETESIDAGEFRTYTFEMTSEIKYTFRFTVIQGGLVDVIFTDQAGFINYNTVLENLPKVGHHF